jgi:hypothetical protein
VLHGKMHLQIFDFEQWHNARQKFIVFFLVWLSTGKKVEDLSLHPLRNVEHP